MTDVRSGSIKGGADDYEEEKIVAASNRRARSK
jgi:hypothetical protein